MHTQSIYYFKFISLSVAIVLVAIVISPFVLHSQEGEESAEDFMEEVDVANEETQETAQEPLEHTESEESDTIANEVDDVESETASSTQEELSSTEDIIITDTVDNGAIDSATTVDGIELLHTVTTEGSTTTTSSSSELSENTTDAASSTEQDMGSTTNELPDDPFSTSVELTPLSEEQLATPEIQEDLAILEAFTTSTDALAIEDATTTASTTEEEYLEIVLEEFLPEDEYVVLAPPSPPPPPPYESLWQRYLNKVFALDDDARHSCAFESDVDLTSGDTQEVSLTVSNRDGSMGELEVGNTPDGISVLFNGEDSYVQFWASGIETRLSVEIKRTLWAQEGVFSVPIFYTKGSSTTLCQLILINGMRSDVHNNSQQEVTIIDGASDETENR